MATYKSKSTDLKLDQLSRLWAEGTFHPIYLFAGADTVQKDEAVVLLKKHFLGGDPSGLGLDKFDGETDSGADIINAAQTMAFLGGRRLVLVRRAHELGAAELNRLADNIPRIPQGNALVLLWDDKLDQRSVLVQAVKSAGVATTFWPPFEDQMPRWAQERARALGKTLTIDAARALVEAVGGDPAELAQEVEKLTLYVGAKTDIQQADVEALKPESRGLQYLEFDRAVWRQDRTAVLQFVRQREQEGDAPEALLAHLARIYRRILQGKSLLAEKKLDAAGICTRFWIRLRQPQDEFSQAMRRYGWDRLILNLGRVLQAERDLKTGRLMPGAGMSLLVCELFE